MFTSLRALIVALAIAGAALAVPAIASAETFCINAGTACPPGGNDFGDLQGAMNAAAALPDDDEILLGDKQTPYFGPFSYDPQDRGNRLNLKGVGGRPSLTDGFGNTVLTMSGGSLEQLDIVTNFSDGPTASIRNTDVKDVKLDGPADVEPDSSGMFVTGPSTLEDLEITGGYEPALTVGGGLAEQEVIARRLLIHGGASVGVIVSDFASLELSDSRVSGRSLAVNSAGFTQIRRSVIETSNGDSVGLNQFSSAGSFDLDHVTVAHRGTPSGADSAFALQTEAPVDTHLHAVALAGYTRGFKRTRTNGFPQNVVISDSVWDPTNDELGGEGAGVFVESGNVHAAPALADLAAGDLRPRAGSAAIDRDTASDASQFADLNGVPAFDGDDDGIVRPDAGAFEFQPAAPGPPPAGGGGAGGESGGAASGTPSADLAAPVLRKLRLTTGRARVSQTAVVPLARARRLSLAFNASEDAKVRIVPRRVMGGRVVKARGAVVRQVLAGRGQVGLGRGLRRLGVLRPGQLRLVITATDAAGNRSAKRVLTLRLKA